MKASTDQIVKALLKKLPKEPSCQLCSNSEWAVQSGTFGFSHSGSSSYSAHAMPSIALVCQICGNTYFINATVLFSEEAE
jgi:transcription elongation factor Elf1